MTQLFEKALAEARRRRPQEQDRIAQMMLAELRADEPEPVPPEHLEAVLEGLSQARAGNLASPEQVIAAFRRFEKSFAVSCCSPERARRHPARWR